MSLYCFLPVESTLRELDYKLNLARYFCKAGFKVVIGNPAFIRDELKYKNYQGFFLEKGLNPTPAYYTFLKSKGVKLYDLSDEGNASPPYSINYKPTIEAMHAMDRVFLWGEKQKLELMTLNPDLMLANKYCVVGSPAFDLSSSRFRSFHVKLKPKSLPKNYILVNTNFGDFNGHSVEEQLKACPEMSPESYQKIVDSVKSEGKQFEVFKTWLNDLIESFPQEKFLIRPHPVEIQAKYEEVFGKYPNVLVSKAGNVNQAIASAKMVLHKNCTTALQSYLMGVPVISLGGLNINQGYGDWFIDFGMAPETIAETKLLIQELLIEGKWNEKRQGNIDVKAMNIINNYFANIGSSSKLLSREILKEFENKLNLPQYYEIIDSRTLVQKIKFFIRKFLPLHYKMPKAARETMRKFKRHEILEKLNCLEEVDPINHKYSIKNVFPNCFILQARK